MKLTIKNDITGTIIPLVRDVRHIHPRWVHEQMGTDTEAELQMCMGQYDDDKPGERDCCGVAVEPQALTIYQIRAARTNPLAPFGIGEIVKGGFESEEAATDYVLDTWGDPGMQQVEIVEESGNGLAEGMRVVLCNCETHEEGQIVRISGDSATVKWDNGRTLSVETDELIPVGGW